MTCRSNIVQTWIVRGLASLAVGAASFYGAEELAHAQWHTQLSLPLALLLAVIPAGITFFVTRAVAGFTEDCMGIPSASLAPGLKETRVDCARGTCARRNPALAVAAGKRALASTSSADAAPGAKTTSSNPASASKITVTSEPASANGAVQITVTTNGVPNSRLKGQCGLFHRLNGIPGVKWSKHTNIGEGRKQVTGVASAGSAAAVLQRLQELSSSY